MFPKFSTTTYNFSKKFLKSRPKLKFNRIPKEQSYRRRKKKTYKIKYLWTLDQRKVGEYHWMNKVGLSIEYLLKSFTTVVALHCKKESFRYWSFWKKLKFVDQRLIALMSLNFVIWWSRHGFSKSSVKVSFVKN